MPLVELLPLAGTLSAPAFFLLFALASLGAPLLALVCLTAGQLRSTQYIEAYARRVLRMALTAAMPPLLAFLLGAGAAAYRIPWLADWVLAAPLGPGLFALSGLAFFASLITLRLSKASARHARRGTPMGPTFILSLLSLAIMWLALALGSGLAQQAHAVLRAPVESGIGVAQLITPDASSLPHLFWSGLAGLVPFAAACAGMLSLEYLVALRDSEPFGREALAQMLRIGARGTLRSSILAMAFLPMLWMHLPEMATLPGGEQASRLLIGLAGASALTLCVSSAKVARSNRPWERSFSVHLGFLAVWVGLTALLSIGLIVFYSS